MTPEWIVDLFNTFAVPIVMLIVFIVGIVYLFKYSASKDEKHDADMKELTEKYYSSYSKVNESYTQVIQALNNNTKVIEKLHDRLDRKD